MSSRWQASLSDSTPLLFQNILIWILKFFKFENLIPVQTLATIIRTEIFPCFCLGNDHTESCCCRNWKVTTDPGLVCHRSLTPVWKNAESCRSRLQHSRSMATSARWYKTRYKRFSYCVTHSLFTASPTNLRLYSHYSSGHTTMLETIKTQNTKYQQRASSVI